MQVKKRRVGKKDSWRQSWHVKAVMSLCLMSVSGSALTDEMTEREIRNALLSRRVATESMVLLENKNQVLPIAKSGKIALFGGGAVNTVKVEPVPEM